MSERTTVTQTTQIGVEVTPGTVVPANRSLQTLSIEPSIQAEVLTFTPKGGKFPTVAALGKEWTRASITGQPSYNEIVYLLASALNFAAPVQQGATAAYLWTFQPGQSAADAVRTFTVEQGSAVRAGRFAYGIVNELGMTFSRDSIELTGSMLGQRYTDGITMTAAPTSTAVVPLLPTQAEVFLDPTSAAIGTTKLTRAVRAEFALADRYGPLWVLDSARESWLAHLETEVDATLTLTMAADSAGMAPLVAMRAGDCRYLRVRTVGPLIAATFFYTFQLDFCGVVSEVSEFSDEDGLYSIGWTFRATHDAAWSRALRVEVTNILLTL